MDGVWFCHVCTRGIEVVDGPTVACHESVEAPVIAQNLREQTARTAARLIFITIVGTHHLLDMSLSDESLEGRKVSFPEVTR